MSPTTNPTESLPRRIWRFCIEPSLVRRLVLAQSLILLTVWVFLFALLFIEFLGDTSELDPVRHDAVLAVVEPLLDRPAAQLSVGQQQRGTQQHQGQGVLVMPK